jgi:hypothetical protein
MSLVPVPLAGRLDRVLADGAHTPQRSRGGVAKVVVVVLVVAAVVVGVIVFFNAKGSTVTTNPDGGGTAVAPETPDFDFKVAKAVAIPVTAGQTPKKLAAAAGTAAKGAVAVMDTVYTEGFLDPSSWEGGDYDDAWSQFTDDAAARAESATDTLTAGSAAGVAYDTIEPAKATVRPRVLMDDAGKAVSVVAVVFFSAKGVHDDGSYTLFKSTGQYFLRRAGSAWKVVAFDVRRADSEKEAPASPSASGSEATTTESPS